MNRTNLPSYKSLVQMYLLVLENYSADSDMARDARQGLIDIGESADNFQEELEGYAEQVSESREAIRELVAQNYGPNKCITLSDGSCVGNGCMHDKNR